MSIQKSKKGLWRFDRTIAGVRLLSRFLYVDRIECEHAEACAIARFIDSGETPQARVKAMAAKAKEMHGGV